MSLDGRTPGAGTAQNLGPGPFKATVIEHLDARNSGDLRVIIEHSSSSTNDQQTQGQETVARYLSPFYGVTSVRTSSQNLDYRNGQQSYGMWFVPPDPGSQVLVILVEGNINQAYWIGCIQDEFMNFMIPDGRAATSNLVEGGVGPDLANKKLPATEFNKNFSFNGQEPNNFAKPVNAEFTNRLIEQGLVEDETRGLTSSSARRESPSMVFGVSTPGPLDKRDGAPRGSYGFSGDPNTSTQTSAAVNHFRSRLGGSSLVMDDGDERLLRKGHPKDSPMEYANKEAGESGGDTTLPHNELTRIRTRTGHQILLHNTEDLIYIANSRGTAWIELTSNGKIDIYSQDSVSVHSAVDLNFTADRDINFTAEKNINMISENIRAASYKDTNFTAGTTFSTNSGKNTSINSHQDIAIYASAKGSIVAGETQTVISAENLSLGSVTGVGIEGHGYIKMTSDGDITSLSKGTTKITAEAEMHLHSDLAFKVKSGNVFALTATGSILAKSDATIGMKSVADTIIKSDAKVDIQGSEPPVPPEPTLAGIPLAPAPVPSTPPDLALRTNRVPMHEPWFQHENLNPEEYTPEKTRAGDQSAESYPPSTPDTFIRGPAGSASQPGAAPNSWNSGGATTTSGRFAPISGLDIPQDPEPVRLEKQALSRIFASKLFDFGFNEEEVYAAIACAETESNLELLSERPYTNSTNNYIRSIFSGARTVSDSELTSIKADKDQFFELVYGPGCSTGIGLGNTTVGDGARFIGRGLIQLTGKGNYQKYGIDAGLVDEGLESDYNPFGVIIVGEPGDTAPSLLLTDVEKSVAVTAAYLKDRYRDFGYDVLGNMRMTIAGTDRGYELGRPKDLGNLENKKLPDGSYDPAWIREVNQERYFVSTVDGYTTYRATADLEADLSGNTGPFNIVPPGTTLIIRDNEAGGQLYEYISDNGTDWRRRNTITGDENGIVRTS